MKDDRPLLLEKICCALASQEINILSADVYTRPDGIVLDIFRVCTSDMKAVEKRSRQLKVVDTLYEINKEEHYEPGDYLKTKTNFLRPAIGHDVEAEARLVKLRRRVAFVAVDIYEPHDRDRLVAHSTTSYVLPS